MPTSKTTIDANLSATAEMKTFVAAFRTKLEAVGFTSTSDTGQYDEAAGVGNNAINSLIGHKILRTPDTDPSHSVMPIYIKARFRTVADLSGKGSYSPTVYPHFGTGSDGASNLSDVWLPHNDTSFMQIANLDVANMWVVRNGLMGGFVIGGLEGDSYDDNAGGFFYHRTVDASGNPTTEGFYGLTFCAYPVPVSSASQPASGMIISWPSISSVFVMPGVYWSATGNFVALANTENYYDRARDKWRGESHPAGGGHRGFRIPDYPSISIDSGNAVHRPYVGDRFDALDRPLPGLVAYHRTAHLIGDTFTLTRYGASRTFLATALRIAAPNGGNNRLDWRLAILWE